MANFATLADLAVRLGRATSSELTAAQQAQGNLLLELATGLILDTVGRDTAWADDLASVPVMLRAVTLEVAARVMQNPVGARSESEQLGQHSHGVSFPDGAHGLMLTPAEAVLCRRTVIGVQSGSAAMDSLATIMAENMPNTLDGLLEEGIDERPIYDWAN